jgi:hypothetical protein
LGSGEAIQRQGTFSQAEYAGKTVMAAPTPLLL